MPTEIGRHAGKTLAALLTGAEPDPTPFAAVPSFWSDQYDLNVQSFGMPGLGDPVLVDGDINGDCIVEYRKSNGDDELVGVVGINRSKDLLPYRKALQSRQQ